MSGTVVEVPELQPHDHVCLFYDSDDERRDLLAGFLRDGFERRHKVVYIAEGRSPVQLQAEWRASGLKTDAELSSGQLVVLDAADAYLRGGRFEPERMLETLHEQTRGAKDEGWEALRITGEMGWVLHGPPGSERLLDYERLIDSFFVAADALAVCQYDRRRFDLEMLRNMTGPHTAAIVGDVLVEPRQTPVDVAADGTIRVFGDIDAHSIGRFAGALAVARGECRVDLSLCRFIDLAGLRVLAESAFRLGATGGELVLLAPPEPVMRLVADLGWRELSRVRVEQP